MNPNVKKIIYMLASLFLLFGILSAINSILISSSSTYEELTTEIDQRDIDTGNALNFLSDETSSEAVYEAVQTLEHPPGIKKSE